MQQFQIRLLRGLRRPNDYIYDLKNTESVGKVWRHVIALILLSGFVSGLSAFFGIGGEYLADELTKASAAEFEWKKLLFLIGQVLWGFFYGAVILYLSSLWFWSMTDTGLRKFLVMQLIVLLVLLVEKLLFIPVSLLLGVPELSSPFSFGPIAQSLTNNAFIVNFFSAITIFKLLAMWIQYCYVRGLTEKSRAIVLGLVLGLNLLYWLFTAVFSIIHFENII
ncbi:hypothetical protein [Bacillus sp. B15-48]|uniref:hypothetical protein n=1 Tax=Bacillus sp. B15-48 TaxID=1548601 RepID=UPI00193F16D1|nr:hypothetical protein [Bacillus sp. B15-48]MBM4761495.1 hypothetical protein [Bacillus sp. B15-48]